MVTSIAVMDEPTASEWPAVMWRLLERIDQKTRVRRSRKAPAEDAAGVDVDERAIEAFRSNPRASATQTKHDHVAK